MSEFKHIPIMLKEVLELLKPERGGIYADARSAAAGTARPYLLPCPMAASYTA